MVTTAGSGLDYIAIYIRKAVAVSSGRRRAS
jgi:hypothetical protein